MSVKFQTIALCIAGFAGVSVPRAEPALKIDCGNAVSTVELNYCASAEFDKADAELNATYKGALKAVPEMASDAPYDAKNWEAALRASQRAWLAYRDAECQAHVAMFWSGGTGATGDIIGCQTELTQARTKELKARYEQGEAAPADAK